MEDPLGSRETTGGIPRIGDPAPHALHVLPLGIAEQTLHVAPRSVRAPAPSEAAREAIEKLREPLEQLAWLRSHRRRTWLPRRPPAYNLTRT